jgi:CRISPR-associated protein Cas5d
VTAQNGQIAVKIWSEYACFSRPEFKVERVSYPVITPSAARGVLEAIFWKPEFRYEIREIGALKQGTFVSILRNELSDRQGKKPIFVEDQRQQRTSLVLKDVAYIIRAEMVLRPHATDSIYKYLDQFRRRVERGQCYHTPYLGTREFAAHFAPPTAEDAPEAFDLDLGLMLFDIAFVSDEERAELEFIRHGPEGPRQVKGYAQPLFFHAQIERGWLRVPPEKYQELYRLEEGEESV